jgi:hypothetical protein
MFYLAQNRARGVLVIHIEMLVSTICLPYRIIMYMCRVAFILGFNDLYCIISNVKYRFMKVNQFNHVTDLFDEGIGSVCSSFSSRLSSGKFHIKQVTCVVS